eukprot:m.157828 g.157828  ORF g.157828 m.157828 type:complete len:222 (+) comp9814_c0_seq2:669-1334(+)
MRNANIYGLVVEIKAQKATRGSDYAWAIFITDESYAATQSNPMADGFNVMLFASDRALFPPIQGRGDIVRIHRMKLGSHNGKLQGTVRLSKETSSILVFSGDVGASFEPIRPQCKTYSDVDRKKIRDLRSLRSTLSSHTDPPSKRISLSQLEDGAHGWLFAQVIAVEQHTPTCTGVFLWDGTVPPSSAYARTESSCDLHCPECRCSAVMWRSISYFNGHSI